MNKGLIILTSLLYLALLFLIAWLVERRVRSGKKMFAGSWVYSLSLAVYCTGWTFYGSVGRAATHGIEFITIYLGPLVTCALFVPVLQKMLRICKTQRINSIADFISTRYGKSFSLGVVVTVCCLLAIIPYIALQLKAVSNSFQIITDGAGSSHSFWQDDSFYITLLLAFFVIVFGTRSINVSERHEGIVGAIAFESVVKLIAFLVVGLFVTYGVFHGFSDMFNRANAAGMRQFFQLDEHTTPYSTWFSMILISMLAMILLPRQFQVGIVENTNERHLYRAVWLFPLYLLIINLFVLPIAMGGLLTFSDAAKADSYVLSLPVHAGNNLISLLAYIGGFSAATGMVIVETIALATMISNHLVLPLILAQRNAGDGPFTRSVRLTRQGSIVLILILAYAYARFVAPSFSLVSIGLVSMIGVAQLGPAVIGGLYWKDASRKGAMGGILAGFAVWLYTLILPAAVDAEYFGRNLIDNGPWNIHWLKPHSLFGLEGLSPVAHATFWSLLLNIAVYAIISSFSRLNAREAYAAEVFTGIFQQSDRSPAWKGSANTKDVLAVMEDFIGRERAGNLLSAYAQRHRISLENSKADARIVAFAERILSGVIGSASARLMIRNITDEEEISMEEVLRIARESQQVLELNKELKKKSIDLTRATDALKAANEQLRQMDSLKDEFLYTVTHELRTPLTSIRAMSEIVFDNPDMDEAQRQLYLEGIVSETERLTHLITQVLNLERYESGRQKLQYSAVNIGELLAEVAQALEALAADRGTKISVLVPNGMYIIQCDREMIYQVVYNLVANALKFVPNNTGEVRLIIREGIEEIQIWVEDNGKGIAADLHELIFDKFFQARNQTLKKPVGSGLGLAICKRIAEMHGGRIWVESKEGEGARFAIALPH